MSDVELVITAYGKPAPQGSKLRTRFGLVDDNAKTLKPWRKAVTAAAQLATLSAPLSMSLPMAGPVEVEITITLARPAAHFRTGRNAHLLRDAAPGWPVAHHTGDVDKFARAACDALTDAAVWGDDVQVVELFVRKVYVDTGLDALSKPGALIRVRPLVAAVVPT